MPTTSAQSQSNAPAQVQNRKTQLHVTGMSCANCARRVAQAIKSVPGVIDALVELEQAQATVLWAEDANQNVKAVIEAIIQAGYSAKVVEPHLVEHGAEPSRPWQLNLWLGTVVTLLLAIGEWWLSLMHLPWFRWLSFALATIVQIFAGAKFYRGAFTQLKVGRSNMDTLVALGSTTAYGYSTYVLLAGRTDHIYFLEAAAIITLISLGHWLETRTSAKAAVALKTLIELAPDKALRLNTDGTELEVPVAQLQPGDLVVLKPGDRVPTDGVIIEGNSAVNEAMLTGEPLPVDKRAGSEVYAGTVNLNGRLVMRVTATGERTALANIIAAVRRAQTSRANIQRLADRVSNVFVPVVVLVAIGTALWWGLAYEHARAVHGWLAEYLWHTHPPDTALAAALIGAAAVLIVACPCAMGLATPTAIMAGSNAAAKRGILVRDGVALEKAGKITAIMLDKTGTLTTGELALAWLWTTDGSAATATQAQKLAAALARQSNHPISKVLARLSTDAVTLEKWEETPGSGVQAQLQSGPGQIETVRLGSLPWLQAVGVTMSDANHQIVKWKNQGATLVGLAKGNSLVAVFGLRDSLKPGAAKVVDQLHRQGLKIYLLTGDNRKSALASAEQIGIPVENVFAEVRPEEKADLVKKLQAQGERVAFVGDGINDAPALKQADLGLAVARATDIARQAADVVLLKSELDAVPEALTLARATLRIIKQNLFWAFFYNAASVPLAALGFLSPILCAVTMGLSDLIVIGNALRLLRYRFAS